MLTAESLTLPGESRSVFDIAVNATMKRAAAQGPSPNRIILLRDADGDGVAETRDTYLENLRQPFGMALVGDTFYVGNTDGVVAFPFEPGATRLAGQGKRIASFKPGGHWTRSLLPNADGTQALRRRRLAQQHRRARHGGGGRPRRDLGVRPRRRHQPASSPPACATRSASPGSPRPAPSGPWSTSATASATRPRPTTSPPSGTAASTAGPGATGAGPSTTASRRTPRSSPPRSPPDYALGGHTASLGLCWLPAGTLPGFPDGMVIGQHGSWNRSQLSGYQVILIPFENGKPAGPARDILTGFLSADETDSYGRPVGVTIGPDGSLLVADDVGDVIWRVTGA